MAQTECTAERPAELVPQPDISHLITRDDTPVASVFVSYQQQLLVHPLYADWQPSESKLAIANVGLFGVPKNPALVPNVMLAMDVELPKDPHKKENQAYFVWIYGKPPDVVFEIVTDQNGGELDHMLRAYERIHVPYHVVFDPQQILQEAVVAVYELTARRYKLRPDLQLPDVGLALRMWEGVYNQAWGNWLRWCLPDGTLLRTGVELVEHYAAEADQLRDRANHECQGAEVEFKSLQQLRERTNQERERAERLAAKLKQMGIDPET